MAAVEMPPNPLDISQTEAPVIAEPTGLEPSESKRDDNVDQNVQRLLGKQITDRAQPDEAEGGISRIQEASQM